MHFVWSLWIFAYSNWPVILFSKGYYRVFGSGANSLTDGMHSRGEFKLPEVDSLCVCQYFPAVFSLQCFQCIPAVPALRECPGKRKRSQEEEEEVNEGRGKENICPNASEKVTPQRRSKNNHHGGQTRLFSQKEEQTATSSSQSHKAKGKQAKTPSQTGEWIFSLRTCGTNE